MKKILALLLAVALCFTLCACGGKSDKDNSDDTQTTDSTDASTADTIESEDDDNSDESSKGSLEAELTDENTIELEGKKIALPISAEKLLDYGWELPEYTAEETLEAGKGASYVFPLLKDGETKIDSVGFFNNSASEAKLEDCDIISLKLVGESKDADETQCSFTLPGEITEDSTYEDVVALFGTDEEPKGDYYVSDGYNAEEEGTELFEKYGFTFSVNCRHSEGQYPYNYTFNFNADKTIESVNVESINYQNAALSAF